LFANSNKTSDQTENPILFFFHLAKPSFSNNISPTCLGDLILKTSHASFIILFSRFLISCSSNIQIHFNLSASIKTQSISIFFKTLINGISILFNILFSVTFSSNWFSYNLLVI
jgi:hypothetical protein